MSDPAIAGVQALARRLRREVDLTGQLITALDGHIAQMRLLLAQSRAAARRSRELRRENSMRRTLTVLLIGSAVVLGGSRDARAQLKGHYIPGFTGLQNGSQGPAAVNLILPTYLYTTSTLKNDDGDTVGNKKAEGT